jgi:hypothetical protein
MGDSFDPYREALVVEEMTIWPDGICEADDEKRRRIEAKLHSHPQDAAELKYVRLPTGFARHISVTVEDIERLKK